MASLPIEERLLHYFLAMGAEKIESPPNFPRGLTVSVGSEKLHVAVLENNDFLQKGKIIGAIMALTSIRPSVDQLYLAAPRLLGTTIDSELFRSHGIGLLLFDDRRIEETVAPQIAHAEQTKANILPQDPSLIAEVASLRSMYSEMERTLAKLKEEFTSYQENMTSQQPSLQRLSSPPTMQTEPKFTTQGAELPSFFVNNPWLEVLSKRGREETAQIAG